MEHCPVSSIRRLITRSLSPALSADTNPAWFCSFEPLSCALFLRFDALCSSVFDFPTNALEIGARLLSSCLLLWRRSPQLALAMAMVLPFRLFCESILTRFQQNLRAKSTLDNDSRAEDYLGWIWNLLGTPIDGRVGRETCELRGFDAFAYGGGKDRGNRERKREEKIVESLVKVLQRASGPSAPLRANHWK